MSKKILVISVCFILTFTLFFSSSIYADDFYEGIPSAAVLSNQTTPVSAKIPNINALSAVVMDTVSGRVLYEKNGYSKRSIASTTKIITAIIAIENGNLEDEVTVSKKAASVWGSTINLKEGQKLKLRELLYGLMLNSGNDAAIAISEYIGGSVENFCDMMTKKAMELGAKNSSFKSPHGLDAEGHYSTAYDLALITRYAIKNKTFSEIVKTQSATIPGKSLQNTNEMLYSYPGTDGVKTGFTGKAGRCLVTSATRNNWRLISVTLGSPTRNARAQSSRSILDYVFNNYKIEKILKKDEVIGKIPVIKGVEKYAAVKADKEIEIPLNKDELDKLTNEIDLPGELKAPVNAGTEIGNVKYLLDGKVLAEATLKIETDVAHKGIFDYLGEIFGSWVKLMEG
jgi:serine-type D-Ala-D-Ala carboxypeptidase (penicillin-binding protein 5/6)